MKRISVAIWIALGIGTAYLGWVWLQRHNGDLRLARTLQARHGRVSGAGHDDSGTAVKITQFYAIFGEMTDADRNTICYGVANAKTVRMEPLIENLWPTATRCFWVEPRQDITYKLIAEGFDGSQTSASFEVHVKPAPPSIVFLAVSHREIERGDAVTLCYGVAHAKAVRLDPIGWSLAPIAKNCARFYPKATMRFTLVASGAGGLLDSDQFSVKVRQ
jgi:hypothetical protein